jgi:uncharacterized protein YndB with AHSA1/START domain
MEASTDVAGAGGSTALGLPDLHFRRVLEAPIALAFRAWTSSACVAAWWGPHGYANAFTAIEPHPGGRYHVHMQAPDGAIQPLGGHVVEIEEPGRVVFVTTRSDGDGTLLAETLHTVTFRDMGGRTEMRLSARTVFAAPAMLPHLAGFEESWRQSLERLSAILKAI